MVRQLVFLFIIPMGYFIYSLYTLKNPYISEEKMNFIKRIYYSIWVFLIVLTIYSIKPSIMEVDNPLRIPNLFWYVIIIIICGILISIILDYLIISGSGVKEISFGFAKVTKNEIKQNIKEQQDHLYDITQLIHAEYEMIQNFEHYIKKQKINYKISQSFHDFPYEDELVSFIDYFYKQLESVKRISMIELDLDLHYKKVLKNEYRISQSSITEINRNIKQIKSTLIKEKNYFLLIPYILFTNEKRLIIIQSNDSIYEIEQRFILNLLKIFENYLVNEFFNYLNSFDIIKK